MFIEGNEIIGLGSTEIGQKRLRQGGISSELPSLADYLRRKRNKI